MSEYTVVAKRGTRALVTWVDTDPDPKRPYANSRPGWQLEVTRPYESRPHLMSVKLLRSEFFLNSDGTWSSFDSLHAFRRSAQMPKGLRAAARKRWMDDNAREAARQREYPLLIGKLQALTDGTFDLQIDATSVYGLRFAVRLREMVGVAMAALDGRQYE